MVSPTSKMRWGTRWTAAAVAVRRVFALISGLPFEYHSTLVISVSSFWSFEKEKAMKLRRFVLGLVFIVAGVVQADTIRVPRDYPRIQWAIDVCQDGDTVLVADGVYKGDGNRDISFGGKKITVRSKNGPQDCTIDCEGNENDPHRGFYFHNSETQDAKLDGFTIKNGYATAESPGGFFGGGVYIKKASPTLTHCTFDGNFADQGGAVMWKSSYSTMANCTIVRNSANGGGSGLYCWLGSPRISNCVIAENAGKGTIACYQSNATITNCAVMGNHSLGEGAGAIHCHNSDTVITNCTITGNSGEGNGGGISCRWRANPIITNCILWDNTPPGIYLIYRCKPKVTYSDVQGGWRGKKNIDADPKWVSGPFGDFYLSQLRCGQDEDSPCLDAGKGKAKELGLKKFTTCTEGLKDKKKVDMGCHYPR